MSEKYDIPKDLRYTRNHEWIRVEGDTGVIGVSDYAQKQLGDITYIEFEIDTEDELGTGNIYATVEAVKASEPCFSPAGGTVTELNHELEDEPELVNSDPYGKGWMIKIDISDAAGLKELLSPEDYGKHLEEQAH